MLLSAVVEAVTVVRMIHVHLGTILALQFHREFNGTIIRLLEEVKEPEDKSKQLLSQSSFA